MKAHLMNVTGAVIAALVLLTGASPPQPPKSKPAAKSVAPKRSAIAGDCTVQRLTIKDTHSQTSRYRGEGLENLDFFKIQGGGAPAVLFPGQSEAPSGALMIEGHHRVSSRNCSITLEPAPMSDSSFAGLRFFKPNINGSNPCDGEQYWDRSGKPVDKLTGLAIAVPGYWQDGVWFERKDGADVFTLSCVSGAVAECAVWGYRPWEGRGNFHRACVQLARARYLRNSDSAYTCNGTEVEIFDRAHILSNTHPKGLTFESLWDETGLVCLGDHPRWSGCEDKLKDVRRCESIPSDSSDNWPAGALIAVASRPGATLGQCPTEPNVCEPFVRAKSSAPNGGAPPGH